MNIDHRHDLTRVGVRVATEQDRILAGTELPDADLLLEGIGRRRRKAQVRRRALGVTMSAFVVLLGTIVALRTRPFDSHASSQSGSQAAQAARAAAASPSPAAGVALGTTRAQGSDVPLRFVDGTRVVLKPGAVADVREVRTHGATIALESGTVDVDVVHTTDSRWDVVAGQFDVRVTGTRFDATWDPRTKQLTVAMVDGTVRVSGPCVDESLSAPSTKVFACNDSAPPTTVSALPEAAPSTPAPALSPKATRAANATNPANTTTARNAPSDDDALGREPAATLLGLGDTARLSGDGARARAIYGRVRERFPRTEDAAKAAFLLGRMAEASGSADEAVRFYETAIADRPNGAFAGDALGRTMELEQRRGNSERARVLAAEYVRRHPSGPYRAYAASVLDAHR